MAENPIANATDTLTDTLPDAPARARSRTRIRTPAPAARPTRDLPRLGPGYWRLWTADGLSNLADGLVKVTLPLLVLTRTHSPALIAGLPLAFSLPWLLFALPAGATVDRIDRRRALIAATITRSAVLAALAAAVLTRQDSIQIFYVAAFTLGTAETVYGTAAQSILPRLVPAHLLPRANGRLFAVELAANEFAGPPLAGLLVAAGATIALLTPFGLMAVALGVMLALRGSFRAGDTEPGGRTTRAPRDARQAAPTTARPDGPSRAPRSTLPSDIAEGLRFVLRDRLLRGLAAMSALYNLATNATLAVFVLYATGPASGMHLTYGAYGLLVAAIAAGSVLGSLVAERVVAVIGRPRSLALSVISGALLVGAPALTTSPCPIAAAFFLGGVGTITWNVIVVSLRQRITPDRLLGRVNSAYRLVAWGVMPIGAALGGAVGQAFGVRAVFAGSAAVMLAIIWWLRSVTETRMAAAETPSIDEANQSS